MFDPGSLRLTYVNRGGADLLGSDRCARRTARADLQPAVSERVFRARLADLREARALDVLHRGPGPRRRAGPAGRGLPPEVTLRDGTRTVVLTARDISERIDVQARLARIAGDERRQAAELRAVIAFDGRGVLVIDPEGEVSMANEAASSLLGVDLAAGLAEIELQAGSGPPRPPTGPAWAARRRHPTSRATRERCRSTMPAGSRSRPSGRPRRRRQRRDPASRIVVLRDVTRARTRRRHERPSSASCRTSCGRPSPRSSATPRSCSGRRSATTRPSCSATSRPSRTASTASSRTCSP